MTMFDYRLMSLGDKIANYTRFVSAAQKYKDPEIQGDDIRYNIASSIANFTLNLLPVPLSTEAVRSIIEIYNSENRTSFTIEQFLSVGWIRIVNETYTFPARIRGHLLRLSNLERFKDVETPAETLPQINCLLAVYRRMNAEARRSLTQTELEALIQDNSGSLQVDDFVSRNILVINPEGNYYYNDGNDYARQLSDRIISAAWFKLTEAGISQDIFRLFLRYLDFADLWPVSLSDYLPNEDIEKIIAFSETILMTEPDLATPELEIRNDHLDRSFALGSFASASPVYAIEDGSPYFNYQQLKYLERHIHDIFIYHESRTPYLLLIRMVFQSRNQKLVIESLTHLFSEHKNPYIKSQVLDEIVRSSPDVLAYFLADRQLAPILFAIVDDLEITKDWLQQGETHEVNLRIANKIKDELWLEAFQIYLDFARTSGTPADYAQGFIEILTQLSQRVFRVKSQNSHQSDESHRIYLRRYHTVVELISSARLSGMWISTQQQPPLLAISILPGMVAGLDSLPNFPPTHELLFFETAKVDIYIELLCIADKLSTESLPEGDQYHTPITQVRAIAQKTIDIMVDYFDVDQVTVMRFDGNDERRSVQRGISDFGLEIIDFAVFFLLLQKLGKLTDLQSKFVDTLRFNLDSSGNYEHDRDQARKVFTYVKISLLAYLGIHNRFRAMAGTGYPVDETLMALRKEIIDWTEKYNRDAPMESVYDIFSINRYAILDSPYSQRLVALLYSVLNTFPADVAKQFVDKYFRENRDLEKLFTALNRIDNREIRAIISAKIDSIDLNKFIDNAISITDLESVLIEAVNSHELYKHAAPLIGRIENHLSKRGLDTLQARLFIFKMKLFLAFKNKDTKGIVELEVPRDQHDHRVTLSQETRKQFYLGLDHFYNHKNFSEAIRIFFSVCAVEPQDVESAFYLYNARVFFDLETGQHSDARDKWEEFKRSIGDGARASLDAFLDRSTSLDLLYYAWRKDDFKFDQTVNTLPGIYLYQEELILPVYENYVRRQMSETGFSYLNAAIQFNRDAGQTISEHILDARDNAVDDTLIDRVRNTMGELRNLPPSSIPRVLPAILNSKKNLQEFILGEIIAGMRIMRKKIKAVESIVNEDHFNDVFLATLRLRLPVFGWEIADQERTGSSSAGTDAGEADIVFKAGGQEIALLEALKMKGQDVTNLQKHVLKCIEYSRDLKGYYMIVYYYGNRENFSNFLDIYKADIAQIPYPSLWKYSSKRTFESLLGSFENSENMFLGRSWHGSESDKPLYHVAVDLSKPESPIKAKTTKKERKSKPTGKD